jgi:hypothetical protein
LGRFWYLIFAFLVTAEAGRSVGGRSDFKKPAGCDWVFGAPVTEENVLGDKESRPDESYLPETPGQQKWSSKAHAT